MLRLATLGYVEPTIWRAWHYAIDLSLETTHGASTYGGLIARSHSSAALCSHGSTPVEAKLKCV